MTKAMICASLMIFGIFGLIIAGSDGPYFPAINFFGLSIMFFCGFIYSKIKDVIF